MVVMSGILRPTRMNGDATTASIRYSSGVAAW